uniref:Uncharacterized protein n=1 Tax=Cucumis melo TaxID=3656 RepID=A0A9I9DHU1_CUCME
MAYGLEWKLTTRVGSTVGFTCDKQLTSLRFVGHRGWVEELYGWRSIRSNGSFNDAHDNHNSCK